jgi:hypothetical protein
MERKRKGDVREKRKGRGKSFPTKREKEDKKMGYFWPIQNKYLLLLHNYQIALGLNVLYPTLILYPY